MFEPGLSIGEVITDKQIYEIFKCQTTFGIRDNKVNNAIVLISDATPNNPYPDEWKEDILYYTGTDAGVVNGNQSLKGTGNNNGKLRDVWFQQPEERRTLYLFIKRAVNQYEYQGTVQFAEEPYETKRNKTTENTVWKFPLKLTSVEEEIINEGFKKEEAKALKKGLIELLKDVKAIQNNPNRTKIKIVRTSTVAIQERNPKLSAVVKLRAKGYCDLCGAGAPFVNKDNEPYLESHHIQWLSKQGEDKLDNMVALCPNCHRKVHCLDGETFINQMNQKVKEYKKMYKI